ncbi:MAG: methyltransferase domain-containing protein [Acidobacteriota bacterium]
MVDPWYVSNLVCPRDQQALTLHEEQLRCPSQHAYPVVDGVPVMLIDDRAQTIDIANASLRRSQSALRDERAPDLHLESLGISEAEKAGVLDLVARGSTIDPVVAYLVAATNGLMYRHLIGSLDRYPLPELPLPDGGGRSLLDVGCSWGRWTFAAGRRGYQAVGIDPSLGAIMAARRVARELGADARFVVGDARHLPFASGRFECVYSYSVLQHLSRPDASQAVKEIGRVLAPGGTAKVQMPTAFGIRCLYHQARRGFREGRGFEVRYWSLPALRRLFTARVGASRVEVDCYFGIGLQRADEPLMTTRLRRILSASEWLKRASRRFRPLTWVADSVFIEAARAR